MHDLRDWRGTPIIRGCTIVYPGREGNNLWLTEAVVEDIVEIKPHPLPKGDPVDWRPALGIDPDAPMQPALQVRRIYTTRFLSEVGQSVIVFHLDRVTVIP